MGILRIILGYAVSVALTGVAYAVYFDYTPSMIMADFFHMFILISWYLAILSVLPFVVTVYITERYKIRHYMFYFAAGIGTSLVALGTAQFVIGPIRDAAFLVILPPGGAFAASVYWLIAGRHAGAYSPARGTEG